jgi:hypothetical protein
LVWLSLFLKGAMLHDNVFLFEKQPTTYFSSVYWKCRLSVGQWSHKFPSWWYNILFSVKSMISALICTIFWLIQFTSIPPCQSNRGAWLFPQGWSSRGVKLTTHLQLVPWSRMMELYLHSLIHQEQLYLFCFCHYHQGLVRWVLCLHARFIHRVVICSSSDCLESGWRR